MEAADFHSTKDFLPLGTVPVAEAATGAAPVVYDSIPAIPYASHMEGAPKSSAQYLAMKERGVTNTDRAYMARLWCAMLSLNQKQGRQGSRHSLILLSFFLLDQVRDGPA